MAAGLRDRAGVDGLGGIGTDDALLDQAVQAALRRPELARVAPAPDADELRAIYRAAAAG